MNTTGGTGEAGMPGTTGGRTGVTGGIGAGGTIRIAGGTSGNAGAMGTGGTTGIATAADNVAMVSVDFGLPNIGYLNGLFATITV